MKRAHLYTLDGHVAVPCWDVIEWGRWFETADRIVAQTELAGDTLVSTVFLGLDHSHGRGERLLFETMVFRKGSSIDCERYPTWEAAEAGHARMVEKVNAPQK